MASDAIIAGVAGLLGVGLSGGTQAFLTVRAERRDRRAAVRMLDQELSSLEVTAGHCARRLRDERAYSPSLATSLAGVTPDIYEQQNGVLARELSWAQWGTVGSAYSLFSMFQLLYTEDHVVKSPEAVASMGELAERSTAEARALLAPLRHRREARRSAIALKVEHAAFGVPTLRNDELGHEPRWHGPTS